jgi:hypothetical protein
MNKKYAMEILEMVERGTLEHNCSLAREAYNYIERLILNHNKINQNDDDLLNRVYAAKHQTRRK